MAVVLRHRLLLELLVQETIGHALAEVALDMHLEVLAHHRAAGDPVAGPGQVYLVPSPDERMVDDRALAIDSGVARGLCVAQHLCASTDLRAVAHPGVAGDLGDFAHDRPAA